MKLLLVLFSLLVAAECDQLQSYSLPNHGGPPVYGGPPIITSPPVYGGPPVITNPPVYGGSPSCGDGQVLHEGRCVVPQVSRHVYVYTVPNQPPSYGPRPKVPLPKVEHNILFVRLPEQQDDQKPVVVPPPQQKNIVYILKKKSPQNGTPVIEVPAPPKKNPEVYFVNYGQGENPILPNGVDLQTVLANNAQHISGQIIGNGGNTGTGTGGNYGNGGHVVPPPNQYSPPGGNYGNGGHDVPPPDLYTTPF